MSDIKWIKIVTDIFDNRKIKQIRKLPEGDAILVIWLQILCLAGQCNDNGLVYFSKDVPYTDEMLSTEFDRPILIIRLALFTFEKWKMIEIVNDILCISNWEKYQISEKLEIIKEKNKIRQARYKDKQRVLTNSNVIVTLPMTLPVTHSNALDIDIELDKDIELEIDNKIVTEKQKPQKHKYGIYKNVLLGDEQLEQLKVKYPFDWEATIENLSEGIELKGYVYKNHLLAIIKWWEKEGGQKNGDTNKPKEIITRYAGVTYL